MDKQWYVYWQKRLTVSSQQRLLWRFLGINIVYIYVGVGAIMLCLPEFRNLAFTGLFAVVLGWGVLVKLVRSVVPRARPYQRYGIAMTKGGLFSRIHKHPNSFPSGHAAGLGALSSVLMVYSPLLGILSFGVVILNGFARLVLGYHYLIDVMVGVLIGIMAGIIAVWVF